MTLRAIIIIAASLKPIELIEETLEELEHIYDIYKEPTVVKDALENAEPQPEYRPNYDQRRQCLMGGHPHKTYWHRIRSNPG